MAAGARAITDYKLTCREMSEAVSPEIIQEITMNITADAADVAYDFANFTPGTFWTEVLAHATYGTVGTAALADVKKIVTCAEALENSVIPEITWTKLQAAATGAGAYTRSYTAASLLPSYTLHAADGATAFKAIFSWRMKPGWNAITGTRTTSGWSDKV